MVCRCLISRAEARFEMLVCDFVDNEEDAEEVSSASKKAWVQSWNTASAILGLFQGLCCPGGLLGVGFVGKIGADLVRCSRLPCSAHNFTES